MRSKRRFPLQAVLERRRRVEDAALLHLDRCRLAFEARARTRERLCAAIAGAGRAYEAAWLEHAMDRHAAATSTAGEELEAARQAAVAAATQRRVLDLLRERQAAAYEEAQIRADEREIAEQNRCRRAVAGPRYGDAVGAELADGDGEGVEPSGAGVGVVPGGNWKP